MALTYPIVTTTNMDLTPCQVLWTPPGGVTEVDLGGSLGNVVVTTKYTKAEIKADQFGTSVLDRRVSGVEVQVTTELAEIISKDIWKIVFPHVVLAGTNPNKYLDFKSAVGDGDLTNAGILRLHPMSIDPANFNQDFYFWKACASADSSISMGPTEQMKLKIVWNILLDTSVSPARVYRHGDHAL